MRLRVAAVAPERIEAVVEVGGKVCNNKGVNVPDVLIPIPALTDKDRADLAFALEQGADWIALSFVQRPEDVAEARALIGDKAALLAKIEKPQAIDRLDEILELADAVMVARGDLGVELPPEGVPPLQNRIVALARQAGKPVVVATQMLESMIVSPTPTRAEVSDVANAIYDGADAVMLSAESAAGPISARGGGDDGPHRARASKPTRSIRRGSISPRPRPRRPPPTRCPKAAAQIARIVGATAMACYTTLGIDRAADRARAAAGADAGDDREHEGGAAARAAVGRARGPHPRRRPTSRRWSARPSAWRCATASPTPGDRMVIMAGVPFETAGSTNVHPRRAAGRRRAGELFERARLSRQQRRHFAGISRARKPSGPTFFASAAPASPWSHTAHSKAVSGSAPRASRPPTIPARTSPLPDTPSPGPPPR